uniref:SWIM-type domain-containing protein n=1 Tax=Setaria italica TaxID=4555 RepID=K3YZ76_SETIT
MDNLVFAVIRKRPYKVLHSYAEHCYTVVCEKESFSWRVCARKQKVTGKWNITKVVGPHNCADHELRMKHPQLTSTLIAKWLMAILQLEPKMKVRIIIRTVEELDGGYVISYGKTWRAKQRAWKMIYADWEAGYEQLPVLFNAIKAVNPGMHYEYIPKPNEWKDGRQIFFHAFLCFPQCVEAFRHCRPIFSINGTFLIGKYRSKLLIAISCDTNNNLFPLAFALVERENNDGWGWFLRLVWLHVVEPDREVGIISDKHQGILNTMREQIEGYAPLHHRCCTRHLAENLLRKDGVKDNFELLQDAARQLEDRYFQRKLEQVRTATNAKRRQWLTGLMRDLDKWTRAHDVGGWRYKFQCSNMAKSFNKLLLGIHGMPVNTIIQFTFYKLIAWFNDRHIYALRLQSAGEKWPPRPKKHLEKAKERAATHEVICFDLGIGTYQVEQRGGTTSDSEVRESRIHVVVLRDFTCTCGKPRQYHFLCSHLPPYDGLKYIADPAYRWNKRQSRKMTRHRMVMDRIPQGVDGAIPPARLGVQPHPPRMSHSGGRGAGNNVYVLIEFLWRPETHTFHLPFGEMAVTLEDCLDPTLLRLLFPNATGDTASWMWIHCLTDWNQAGQYSWGSAILGFLYRQLCEACRRSTFSASLGGCMYLLQLWMWAHLPAGRPEVLSHPYLWDQVKVPHSRLERACCDFTNELDMLTTSSVSWEPYVGEGALAFSLSTVCSSDDD